MNRFIQKVLIAGLAGIALMATLGFAAGPADDAVAAADKAANAAFAKGDKTAANRWLDPDFSWIDSEGIMWAKDDALRAGLKPLVTALGDDAKLTEHRVRKERRLDSVEPGQQILGALLGEAPERLEAAAHHRNRGASEARFQDHGAHLRDSLQ